MNTIDDLNRRKMNPPLLSPANAWIICDSKSRPGCKYYYNPVLGIPVWNLSDLEIAAAIAEKNAGTESSEPPGPPPLSSVQPTPTLSPLSQTTTYNKQIINNQVSRLLMNQQCNNIKVWEKPPLQSQQFEAAFSAVDDKTSIQQVIQQILPVTNVPNTDYTICVKVQKNLPNESMSKMCKNMRKHNNWSNGRVRQFRQNFQNNSFYPNHADLRQKLVRRRFVSESFAEDNVEDNVTNFSAQNNKNEIPSRLDLSALKTLTSLGYNYDQDQRYIVVDTDIMLNNYTYLDTMISQDGDCHLVVPHHVLSELEAVASEKVQARRILRFLTDQIESGRVILGDQETGDNTRLKIITTCVKLSLQNNCVILISDNETMVNYKFNNHGIYVFTMQDIKDIIAKRPIKPKVPQRTPISPIRAIKIIIPNNENENTSPTNPESVSDTTQPGNNERCIKTETVPDVVKKFQPENTSMSSSGPKSISDVTDHTQKKEKLRLKRNYMSAISTIQTNAENKSIYKWRAKNYPTTPSPDVASDSSKTEPIKINDLVDKQTIATGISQHNLERSLSNTSRLGSECSSKTSHVNVDAIVTPETSIASNDVSIKTDSPTKNTEKKITIREPEMFHVAGQSMAEVLETRCDEWVSRFVQIMEEVLREKLQEDPPFENKEYPPPWHLHEAAKCIIKKFSEHFNVVNAANKLSFVLYKISDTQGKINKHIEAAEYMEMYSYGLYLVQTLQNLGGDCEDLQTASQSLKKLLFDIQNANSEVSTHDTFMEASQESLDDTNRDRNKLDVGSDFDASNYYPGVEESLFPEVTEMFFSDNEEMGFSEATDVHYVEQDNDSNQFPVAIESHYQETKKKYDNSQMKISYNLRSQKNIHHGDNLLQKDPMIGKNKTAFLKSLCLKKTFHTNCAKTTNTDNMKDSSEDGNSSSPIKIHQNNQLRTVDHKNVEIKRIFIKFPEFENKIKNKYEDEGYLYEDDEVDYSEMETMDEIHNLNAENTNTETTTELDEKLDHYLGVRLSKLKPILSQVYLMCKQFVGETDIAKKLILQETIKEACTFVKELHSSLDSFIKHERNAQDARSQVTVGHEDLFLHPTKYAEYWDMIEKTKEDIDLHINVLGSCARFSV